jgi:DNA-binding LytR/AlgR family response regulator
MIFWAKDKISDKIYSKEPTHSPIKEVKVDPILELNSQINYILKKDKKGNAKMVSGVIGQKNKHFVPVNQITHIKSQGHYLLIYVNNNDKPIIERLTFDEILTKLPKEFLRIHRSYMVHTAYVTKYNSSNVWLNYTIELSLSRTYKAPFFKFMTSQVSSEKKVKAQ